MTFDPHFYEENGYFLLKQAIDPELVQILRRESDAIFERMKAARHNNSFLWPGSWLPEERRVKQDVNGAHDVQYHSAAFLALLTAPRILDAVEAIIGPNIQLHHTKLIVKPPERGAPFPMHQDYPYFPHERHTMLAVSVHLDDADETNGCLRVVPGSHQFGPLPTEPDGLYLNPQTYPIHKAVPCPAQSGDALIFSYLTIHGSDTNTTDRIRRNVLLQLRAPDDRPTADTHHSHAQGMMLRGVNPLTYESRDTSSKGVIRAVERNDAR